MPAYEQSQNDVRYPGPDILRAGSCARRIDAVEPGAGGPSDLLNQILKSLEEIAVIAGDLHSMQGVIEEKLVGDIPWASNLCAPAHPPAPGALNEVQHRIAYLANRLDDLRARKAALVRML